MKKLSSKMKVLLVMAVCVAFIVPSVASAQSLENELLLGGVYEPGDHTVVLKPLMGTQSGFVTTSVRFEVVNGTSPGENMASSVKIALLDENKKGKHVVISPDQFNQKNFSNALGTIGGETVEGLSILTLSIRVRGPKGAKISLDVKEHYKRDWQRTRNPASTWPR